MADAQANKPSHSDFKQQTLKAWRPVLTPSTVLPTFGLVGVVFLAVGIALLVENNKVEEFKWEYTHCADIGSGSRPSSDKTCSALTENSCLGKDAGCGNGANFDFAFVDKPSAAGAVGAERCKCTSGPVRLSGFSGEDTFLYYALDNYYQNHRRYVDSRSDPQLRSKQGEANEECNPLESVTAVANDTADPPVAHTFVKYYAPCGLIANSLFNDTIKIKKCKDDACTDTEDVPLDGAGISWESDRKVKFKNPGFNATLCDAPAWSDNVAAPPPNWPVRTCEVGTTPEDGGYNPWSPEFGSTGHGYENEDFIVWMRTAALPNFRKLYRKMGAAVADGVYQIEVDYNYPVTAFDGKKHVVISTTSSIGGKNAFLGAAYITVGCLALAAAVVFFVCMQVNGDGKRNTDINNMKW